MQRKVFVLLVVLLFMTAGVFLPSGCAREYRVELETKPENAGEVSGEGVYMEGEDIAVKAEPHEGYEFVRWEEDGNILSTSWNYPFIVRENRELVAVFEKVED